ncbi:MAG TPA: choice-of-anchor G family protein [Jatrophihabitans sp.]|jgi:hypothetical protein|nr:choice-of-anchor G family protein [Jatrophihabitans sp.]
MTVKDSTLRHRRPGFGIGRRRWIPVAAGITAAALTAAAIATAGGGSAGAAAAPNAQSAGNFLDATIAGKPIDGLAKLAFARAQNPGSVTDQNPLDVTLLNTVNLPLTGALQLPKLLGIDLGAANQTALAKSDGRARGSAGAVLNSGGVSVGGDHGASPANASIDLCGSAISGGRCGTDPADALGELKLSVGAVASVARTPQFGPALAGGWPAACAQSKPTCYEIAALNLQLGSPALGDLLGSVNSTVSGVLGQLGTALAPVLNALNNSNLDLPGSCVLSPTAVKKTLHLDGGAVTIDIAKAQLGVDVAKLLARAGLDLNNLPPNTDLIAWLLKHLGDVLTSTLSSLIDGIVNPLVNTLDKCVPALNALTNTVSNLLAALRSNINDLQDTLNGILDPILKALGDLTDAITGLVDVGVNVQPQVKTGAFHTSLDTNPKQGMTAPPVPYQHTVRAIEIQALGSNGITVALANSAAGPSNPTVAPPVASTPAGVAPTSLPTGVPAGAGAHGGNPVLPIVLLAMGLMFAAGGVAAYRMRGSLN